MKSTVLAEDIVEEPAGPALSQVGSAEIVVGEDQPVTRMLDRAVEMDQAAKVVAEREGRGMVDRDFAAAFLPERRGEVTVEICRDEANVEWLRNSRQMEDSGVVRRRRRVSA